MYPALSGNFKKGKGGLYMAEWLAGVAPDAADLGVKIGNCESITFGPTDVQTTEKYSSTQNNAPLLIKQVDRVGYQLAAQCDEHTKDNLLAFFGASQSTIAQVAGASTKNLANVVVGRSYMIGSFLLSSVVVMEGSTVKVLNTDYALYPERGVIEILGGSLINNDDVTVEFTRAVKSYTRLAVGQSINRTVKLSYFADDATTSGITARDILIVPKAAVIMDGEYQLISDDFGTFNLQFDVLDDSVNYPGRGLGWFERGAAVA